MLGGTGPIGRAVGRRLAGEGWQVVAVARSPRASFPHLVVADRYDAAGMRAVVGDGADLIVDCLCYTAAHAASLLPLLADAGSAVVMSARAVYVDGAGHHVNSAVPPCFDAPVAESQPTVAPSGSDEFDSREGYAACKVAAERVLLGSGYPVTVLRAAKVHGAGSSRPVAGFFLERLLGGGRTVRLARPADADHLTAAANVADLVTHAAARPAARILNVADADAPTLAQAAQCVAAHLGRTVEVVADPLVGTGPGWGQPRPMLLDTSAARALGHRPRTFAATIGTEVDWLARAAAD